MMLKKIPVYDICSIDEQTVHRDLLIDRFGTYLSKHYQDLHRPHRHTFYHFVLFTKGKGSHTIDFAKFRVEPFQMYFMIPGQVHSWHFESPVDGYIVHFNESLFSSFLQNSHFLERFIFFQGNAADCICKIPMGGQDAIIDIFEIMLREITLKNIDMVRIKLLELFLVIEKLCDRKPHKQVPRQKQTLLRNFQSLIDKHFRTIRLPKEYAELLYVTPNHLNALCRDLLGKTAGDMIRERVVLEAKRLLTNADMSVAQIAYELNFQDNSYFVRFFKKEVGTTPDDFRKQFDSK
jgi:AraC family transcriptional activator of pobA